MKNEPSIVINKLTVASPRREQIDIARWQQARKSAESVTNPIRTDLYDIYSDILVDAHLTSSINKRKSMGLAATIHYMTGNSPNRKAEKIIKSMPFKQFLKDIYDTIFWGFSLFEILPDSQTFRYTLIPRKHVCPELGIIKPQQSSNKGIPYRNNSEYKFLVEAGNYTDLGLLLKASPVVIYKRNSFADWAQAVELIGQPMREGIYDSWDEAGRQKLHQDLLEMGGSGILIHPRNTEIKLVESQQKAASSQLYDKFMQFCNAEISKLILGNTLTTEQGDKGARSLGDIHENEQKHLVQEDKEFILSVLNDKVKPMLRSYFSLPEGEFRFDNAETVNLQERITIDMQVAQMVPISAQYWYDTYGVEPPKQEEKTATNQKTETQATNRKKTKPYGFFR
ncbi:MAG: DUF935 family protein [Bacteroidales bacterium]